MVINLASVYVDGEVFEYESAMIEVSISNGRKTWVIEIEGCKIRLDFNKGKYSLECVDQLSRKYSGSANFEKYLPAEGYIRLQGTGPLEGLSYSNMTREELEEMRSEIVMKLEGWTDEIIIELERSYLEDELHEIDKHLEKFD